MRAVGRGDFRRERERERSGGARVRWGGATLEERARGLAARNM